MKTLLIGMAAAGLVGVTTARAEQQTTSGSPSAQTPSSQSSPTQTPSSGSSMGQTPSSQTSTSQASSSAAGTTASASNEVSGVVKKVDKDKQSLKISSTTGGDQELKVSKTATITRDGTQAGLDQIKEGDQVRASLDASGSQASTIEVNSKQKTDDKNKSDTKTQGKY
jgi:Cu/Ag efflux protein CusF